MDRHTLQRISDLDRRIVTVSKSIKILSSLSWPASSCEAFLSGWKKKKPKLPKVEHPRFEFGPTIRELKAIEKESGAFKNPVADYVRDTARSYIAAARMLSAVGRPEFVLYSTELYGRPDDPIAAGGKSHLHAAEHFITLTEEYIKSGRSEGQPLTLSPEKAAVLLRKSIKTVFGATNLKVEIDPKLASKAVAGSTRIRLRKMSKFSVLEVEQLVQHEAFVHAATLHNGRQQEKLPSLGLGSPRTTKTQEGLATLAELITLNMEIGRLRRLALRTKAVHEALNGADFIEVFKLFLNSKQSETESFYSAMRVFRGGDVRGKIAFTKDIVYLQGLIDVHAFVRKALHNNQIERLYHLLAGRMHLKDVERLEPLFESGFLRAPTILAPWAQNKECLAAHFGYLSFAHEII